MTRITSPSPSHRTTSTNPAPTHYHSAPSMSQAIRGGHSLQMGQKGPAIEQLQQRLNAAGAHLQTDGKFGPDTDKALRSFQGSHQLNVDGLAGPKTLQAFKTTKDHYVNPTGKTNHNPVAIHNGKDNRSITKPSSRRIVNPRPAFGSKPANMHASIEKTYNKGRTNQRVDGHVTVNGHSYPYRDGGKGYGNAPVGDYKVTKHLNFRDGIGYSVPDPSSNRASKRYGFSFKMERKDGHRMGDDKSYDPRTNRNRSYLRIHPDGGSAGTHGCMGIVGNAALQKQFKADMDAEIKRHGGSVTLHFGN